MSRRDFNQSDFLLIGSQKARLPNQSKKQQQQEQKPLQIVGGQHHTVLCQNGSAFAIGRKEYGRLGLGENVEDSLTPKKIPDLQNVTTVAAGTACSFARHGSRGTVLMGDGHQSPVGDRAGG